MRRAFLFGFGLLALVGPAAAQDAEPVRPFGAQPAGSLAQQRHWKEARAAFDLVRRAGKDWHSAAMKRAVEGSALCSTKLREWDVALAVAEDYVGKTRGTLEEAIGQRFLAGLYLSAPHAAVREGGKLVRNRLDYRADRDWWRADRRAAIERYERARALLAEFAAEPATPAREERARRIRTERIGVDFDLAAALLLQEPAGGNGPQLCAWWWLPAFPVLDDDDADAEEKAALARYDASESLPEGLPLTPDGEPRFRRTPESYASTLGDGAKVRFLLEEIERLDESPRREDAATALLRRALIARSLYGPQTWSAWFARVSESAGRVPAVPARKVWELEENQALAIAGAQVRLITLPPEESPLALLKQVGARYPQSRAAAEAEYSSALYLQSRQQFPAAEAVYRRILASGAGSAQADARQNLRKIQAREVAFEAPGAFLPGAQPQLNFRSRNTPQIHFRAVRIDLGRLALARMRKGSAPGSFGDARFAKQLWRSRPREVVAAWSETLPANQGGRVTEGFTHVPIVNSGAFVVEAFAGPAAPISRVLVFVTDVAVVKKSVIEGGLIYVANARTGQPLEGARVRICETWNDVENHKPPQILETTHLSDRDGIVRYPTKHPNEGSRIQLLAEAGPGRIGFLNYWEREQPTPDATEAMRLGWTLVTDRPIYRPGSTVQFRLLIRLRGPEGYLAPVAGEDVRIEVLGPNGDRVRNIEGKTDEAGGVSGAHILPDGAPLGRWHFAVFRGKDSLRTEGFLVEEYKKPEFEVTVTPSEPAIRLGRKAKVKIAARYYFGAPVTNATVTYKVSREDFVVDFCEVRELDWLYGSGYARRRLTYPWLPWSVAADASNDIAERARTKSRREIVASGRAALQPDGSFELEIDTSPAQAALGDRDHLYSVEASVCDASRRTVKESTDIFATRQEFQAYVETDAGWYGPGSEARVDVRVLTPSGTPVSTAGELRIARIHYGGPDLREITEEILSRSAATTDAQGRFSVKYAIPREGEYRARFVTQDSAAQSVEGNAVFWVNGPGFDGRVYQFNDLEIITDRSTYKIGEVARLLVQVREDHARVLFSDDARDGVLRSWRFLDFPARTTVIEVPIEARHVPNFHVEATVIRNGRVHSEARSILVPPERAVLDVTVKAERESYAPGAAGRVRVEAKDAAGQPAQGEVVLRVFDSSLSELSSFLDYSSWKDRFHGRVRSHSVQDQSTLGGEMPIEGGLAEPQAGSASVPEGWNATWVLEPIRLRLTGEASARARRRGELGGFARYAEPQRVIVTGSYIPTGETEGPLPVTVYGTPAPVVVRADFADTALWLPRLALGPDGTATADITFPDSVTRWTIRASAISPQTEVGDARASVTTTKGLIVRLQSPRFFIERDEVVLSANAHNHLTSAQRVKAELVVPAAQFEPLAAGDPAARREEEGNLILSAEATIAPGSEHRFDWPLRALRPGVAKITVKLLAAEESDAVQMAFPVLLHGIGVQLAAGGAFRPEATGTRTLKLDLPAEIDPAQTRLEISLTPSLAGVLVDALPYLAGYPYGCVEQTMSRFYPSAVVTGVLKRMGTDLETIGRLRSAQAGARAPAPSGVTPGFDSAELARMTSAGLLRIASLQRSDGAWGWWSEDDSSAYQTASVLHGLHAARVAGVEVNEKMYRRGFEALKEFAEKAAEKPAAKRKLLDQTTEVFLAYVLGLEKAPDARRRAWLLRLFAHRGELNHQGLALLALALEQAKLRAESALTLRNLLQFVERDDSNETAWVRTPREGWWFWYNNDIETNAWALRALVALDPKSDLAPRLVKWLVNNRAGGHYWRGTRDTALVITAVADYLRVSGEETPDFTAAVRVDGGEPREFRVTKGGLLASDQRLVLGGPALPPGPHLIEVTKTGRGALYYAATLNFFTKEPDIASAGGDIAIEREYFKLVPRVREVAVASAPGAGALAVVPRVEKREGITRVPLQPGDEVKSGDRIEVVLRLKAKNTYDYLAFEDRKPAGCEAVEVRSGGRSADSLCANVEFRDTKVVFFIALLEQGEHELRYELRAETPGSFRAPPATAFAMYAPELRANSRTMRLRVGE